MPEKPNYEELEQRVKDLEKEAVQHKQVEEALRESEERFRLAFEESPLGMALVGHDFKLMKANKALCDMLGYSEPELTDRAFVDITSPEDIGKDVALSEDLFNGKIPSYKLEKRFLTKGGEILWGALTATVIRDQGGNPLYGLGMVEDITERKQVQEEASYERDLMQTLLDNIPDYIYFKDRDRRFVRASNFFGDLFGCSLDEIIGKKDEDLFPEEIAKETASDDRRVIETGIPLIDKEEGGKSIGGGEHWVLTTKLPWRDKEGNIIGLFGISREITRRKQTEEALRESEKKYRTLFEDSRDPVVIATREGKLVNVNQAWLDLYGYTREEIADLNAWQLYVNPDDRSRFQQKIEQEGSVKDSEVRHLRKDGTEIECLVTSTMRRANDGSIVGYEAIVRDITEKKKLEAQLGQAQKVEAIGTLAGGIAHNFNNLLMGVMGNTSLMLLETDSSHPNYERLESIEKSVQNGSRLTRQLLGYAREGSYEINPISLNHLVKETSDSFAMTKKEIRVHQDLAKDLFGINADQGEIAQVLLNLYVNAADAMPGGGDLFLKTMNVSHKEISDKPYKVKPGNYVLLTVRDTGIGMDRKTLERIFDPFFTTKGLAEGTGLGLASVYGIVKAHGGYIDIDSEKGKGTTFSIYLPATEKEVKEEREVSGEILKGKGTVLLVDDEDMVLDAAEQMLRKLGYEVLLAEGGREAIELYMDMVMPDMGGGETYDRMREINPDIKVLLSSGYSIDGQATEILKRGCDGFIQKPFSMKELSQNIREIVDKE